MRFPATMVLALVALTVVAEPNTWQGTDPNRPIDWHTAGNWTRGAVPDAAHPEDVLIPGERPAYPVLAAETVVGGSLRLERHAKLTLAGQRLVIGGAIRDTVEGPNTAATAEQPRGLTLDQGATLDATAGTPEIVLRHGGLLNQGAITGSPVLRVTGAYHSFLLRLGDAMLKTLALDPSPYPYGVLVAAPAIVTGNVELAGGNLVVGAQQTLRIDGDLLFRGRTPPAVLTPDGEVTLRGTIRSEGSAAFDRAAGGWVVLTGRGEQTITTEGILPPLKLAKPAGQVTLIGDLHTPGLWVAPGNTLRLAPGQKLAFGVPWPEWRFDPQDKLIVKTWQRYRSSRDLLNQGTILAEPAVPFVLYLHDGKQPWTVTGTAKFPKKEAATGPGLPGGSDPDAGRVSIGRPESRLQLTDGKLTLDNQPVMAAQEQDDLLDEAAEDEKARLHHLAAQPFALPPPPGPEFVNVAPNVSALHAVPSIGYAIWDLVDNAPATSAGFRSGIGGGGLLELIFPQPVAVSTVRFGQGGLFAIRYVLYADTTGDGVCNTVLAAGSDGAPGTWSQQAFAPTTVHRLRFRALEGQQGWEKAYPDLCEFAVYATREAAAPLLAANPVPAPAALPAEWPRLTLGAPVQPAWPEPPPAARVRKCITADVWMFGIASQQSSLPPMPLAEFPQCRDTLRDIKGMGADGVLLFVEADMQAFWPSINFRSFTNQKFFAEVAAKKRPQISAAAPLEEKPAAGDDVPGLDEPEAKDPKGKPVAKAAPAFVPVAPSPKDLPNQRDLLRELVDAAHGQQLELHVIFLGRFPECYVGPPDQDAWKLLMAEVAARGVDGISVTADESYPGSPHPEGKTRAADDPVRLAFKQRFGPDSDLPESIWQRTVDFKRWVVFYYEGHGRQLRSYRDAIRAVNPQCATLCVIGSGAVSGNNRMTYGLAYDVMGHLGDLDYFGTDYQSQEARAWAAASLNRRGAMELYVPPSVREGVQAVMQGTRFLAYYRYNYIATEKSAEHRRREFAFIRVLERCGALGGPGRPPAIACLISRAAEDWWDNDHGTNWLGWNPEAKQGFWTSRLINEFLLRNGYPFDLYYLDQPADLANLAQYRVLLVPFPYALAPAAVAALTQAHAAGARLLIAQKRGEVDDVGRAYPQPALQELIAKGQADGSVVFVDRNLVEAETERVFDEQFSGMLDRLLGEHKELSLQRNGRRIEACLATAGPRQQSLVLINWEDQAADCGIGLNLPAGQYRLLAVSADRPVEVRTALLADRDQPSAADLKRFVVNLGPREVRLLHVSP